MNPISIHASAKEATDFEYFVGDAIEFQSTPPRRRRLSLAAKLNLILAFQSTPPRRRRRYFSCDRRPLDRISIHASAKEATAVAFTKTSIDSDFNPRLREGGDAPKPHLGYGIIISIHASAKEATATYCNTSAIMYISSLNNFFVRYF